jgi:hypothetical protein
MATAVTAVTVVTVVCRGYRRSTVATVVLHVITIKLSALPPLQLHQGCRHYRKSLSAGN